MPEVYGFQRALPPVLVHEGGNVDHPKDPGGRTRQGVTQRVYNAWRANNGKPKRDVYSMTNEERDSIYRQQYWAAMQGDKLPEGLAYAVFDGAVNSGPKQAIKWLQRALGVAADGVLGQITLDAINDSNDHDVLIMDMLDRRMIFLKALKTWKTFGRGWKRRVDEVRDRATAWATGSIGPAPEFIPGANHKASIEDAKTALPRAPGDIAAGAGAATGVGAGPLIDQAKNELGPLAAKLPFVNTVIFWLVVAGVVVAAGGLVYRFVAARQEKALRDALDT